MKKINHVMTFTVMFIAMSMFLSASYVFAQQTEQPEKQVKVKIVKKENGQTQVIEKTFSSEDQEALEEFLQEFDVDHKLGEIKPDEEVEVVIRKKKQGDVDKDVVIDIDDLSSTPLENRGFLGVFFEQPTAEEAKEKGLPDNQGVVITEVMEESAAEEAGLQEGDFVTKVNDQPITGRESFYEAIKSNEPGTEITLTYYRDGKPNTMDATLGEKKMMRDFHGMGPDFKWMGNCHGNMKMHCDGDFKDKPFLGVVPDLEGESTKGVAIEKVIENSTAAEMGLQEGDVIVEVNGQAVNDLQELRSALKEMKVGEKVEVALERDGQIMKKEAPIQSMADNHHFNVQCDGEKMAHCFEKWADQFEDLDINNGELKENLEKTIQQLKLQLEKLEGELQEVNGDNDGNEDVVKEIQMVIKMEDVTEDDLENMQKTALSATNTLDAENLKFSPNPNNGQFNLSFTLPDKGKTTIRIYDLNNKEVYSETLNKFSGEYNNQIDISDKAKGVYFLQVTQNNKALNKKIVIQ